MSEIDSTNCSKSAAGGAENTIKRKGAKKAKAAKKSHAKKAGSQPKSNRTNKKARVIAMMKRARGASPKGTLRTILRVAMCCHHG